MRVFDGHNDALSRLWNAADDPVERFGQDEGHVNIPACMAGGMGGGFFAIYSSVERKPFDFASLAPADLVGPLPLAIDEGAALVSAMGEAGIAQRLHEAGQIKIVTDAQSLGQAFVGDALACILHLEGADCIGADLLALEALYAMGLRSLGIVWSRPTIFGEGVPFGFDQDGDTGPGLTADGKRLVARCKELGVIVDTSHLTMKGFWDVADLGVPLVATHSNAIEVCNTTRNLTDDQLRAVRETGGIVGLNFGTVFLDPVAWENGRCNVDACIRQLAHMVEVAGEDHVAIGSDFDGAPMPDELQKASDLPVLIDAMRKAGFGEALIAKITNENWLSFLSEQLG